MELSSKECSNGSQADTSTTNKEQSEPRDGQTTTTRNQLWTARRVVMFVLLSFVYFLTWCGVSLWSPFLPIEAAKRGVTSTEVGFIYGTYSLVSFAAASFYGPVLIPRIGPYFVLFAGLFINGGASVICGFVDLIQDRTMFAIYLFIVRAVGALGGSACETAVIVIVTGEFRENIGVTIGILRVFTGLGFIIGPVLGGGLYSIGGFRFPLVVTGGSLLAALPLVWLFLPRKEYHPTENTTGKSSVSLKKAVTIPAVIVICVAYFIGVLSISFIEPTLQPFAQTLGVTPTGVGLLFLSMAATYMFTSPVLGYILDNKPWRRAFILIGSIGIVVGLLFIGPAPFMLTIIPRKVWILTVSLGFSGVVFSFFFTPILPELLECFHERGFPKNLSTDSLVSGLYTAFANLGGFVGPAVGGILTGSVGFPWTCTIVACVIIGQVVILSVFFYCNRRKEVREVDPEREHLITSETQSYETINVCYRRSALTISV